MRWKTSPLPAGYQQVNWIGTTGTQYIDTGIYGTKNIDCSVTFSKYTGLAQGGDARIFGDRYSSSSRRFTLLLFRDNPPSDLTKLYINCGASSNQLDVDSSQLPDIITISKVGNNAYLNNDLIGNFGTVTTFTTPRTLTIGNFRNNGTAGNGYIGHFYQCEVNGNTFIPCYRILDNVIGMYNITTNTFLTNAGTGTFTYG